MEGQKEFVQIDQNELFPYLLVNIGSGVSMIKVQFVFPSPFFSRMSRTSIQVWLRLGCFLLFQIWYRLMERVNFSELAEQMLVGVLIGAWEGY